MSARQNPPAFPRTGEGVREGETHPRYDCPGMTLRDWFAGQALAGIGKHLECHHENVASHCYGLADAMLAAREQRA